MGVIQLLSFIQLYYLKHKVRYLQKDYENLPSLVSIHTIFAKCYNK